VITLAKYDVTYACGHSDTIQLYGPGRDRDWKLAREESKLCPDCYKAKLEADRQKQNAEAAEANQAAGLPVLEGTEKQITRAETIRKQIIECIEKNIFGRMDTEKIKEHPEIYQRHVKIFESIKQHTNASWWIDNRGYTDFYGLQSLFKKEFESMEKLESAPPAAIVEAAKAEATVYPEKAVSNLVAEITVKNNTIEIHYPERNEGFRVLVKKLGYQWENGWARKITERTGSAVDRAAEAGNKLLAAGFPIRIYDETVRQKAISGEYEPECRRWVQVRLSGEYEGWLAINWDGHNEDLYRAAKKIAGARWSNPSMVVPSENYLEVLDFAEMYKFNISQKAKEVIENAKALREVSLTTGVKVPKSERLPKPGDKPETLEVPQEVDIDDEFRD
jgi:hypothetical protein